MNVKTNKSRWDFKKISESRAKREGASAPRKGDLKVYEKFLKLAIKNKKISRVLILGATPELRDLCLKHGCETIAVDVSWMMLVSMNEAMEYKDDGNNKSLLYDWLKLDKLFRDNSFDAVLADASLNNLKLGYHALMFKILNKLLKPKGRFITRHVVIQQDLVEKGLNFMQKAYDKKEVDWLEFYVFFIILWHKHTETAPYQHSVAKMNRKLASVLNKKVFFRKEDQWKIDNIMMHAEKIIHTELPKEKFEKIASRRFIIEDEGRGTKNREIRFMPIYCFKNKK